ncbi:hypothetical protein G7046_g8731 [Stylonectria norvegica]|nr:hypothetical protein G7046_g8731 [Stylonectria norvegica]
MLVGMGRRVGVGKLTRVSPGSKLSSTSHSHSRRNVESSNFGSHFVHSFHTRLVAWPLARSLTRSLTRCALAHSSALHCTAQIRLPDLSPPRQPPPPPPSPVLASSQPGALCALRFSRCILPSALPSAFCSSLSGTRGPSHHNNQLTEDGGCGKKAHSRVPRGPIRPAIRITNLPPPLFFYSFLAWTVVIDSALSALGASVCSGVFFYIISSALQLDSLLSVLDVKQPSGLHTSTYYSVAGLQTSRFTCAAPPPPPSRLRAHAHTHAHALANIHSQLSTEFLQELCLRFGLCVGPFTVSKPFANSQIGVNPLQRFFGETRSLASQSHSVLLGPGPALHLASPCHTPLRFGSVRPHRALSCPCKCRPVLLLRSPRTQTCSCLSLPLVAPSTRSFPGWQTVKTVLVRARELQSAPYDHQVGFCHISVVFLAGLVILTPLPYLAPVSNLALFDLQSHQPMVVMSQHSMSESEGRYLEDGYWRHGRFYGSWKRGKYLFPIDSEELNRLDIFHKVFLVARQNKPFHVPIMRQVPKIIDLGTGTSIWAINLAEEYVLSVGVLLRRRIVLTGYRYFREGQIMVVDLNQIQPPLIPVGIVPQQYDIEEPTWDALWTDCDFIHIRMLLGSIQTDLWPQVYRNVFEHLAPGIGHMEHVEIDWTPRWDDDNNKPENSAFKEWAELFYTGMDEFNRTARIRSYETRQMIEAAGFTEFKEEVIKAYVCPWSQDRRIRELARWFNLGLSHSLESLSFMPLIEKHGMKYEEVRELCKKVKNEICVLRYHTYCTM